VIDAGGADAGAMWQSITTAPAQGGGLAPMPQARGEWAVAGQTPRRQTTLADLSTIYQHFIARTERKTRASFEVKAGTATTCGVRAGGRCGNKESTCG
jgi:hypothetical protein